MWWTAGRAGGQPPGSAASSCAPAAAPGEGLVERVADRAGLVRGFVGRGGDELHQRLEQRVRGRRGHAG